MEDTSSPAADGSSDEATAPILGPNAAKYLDDRAAESFKRQTDLEESIWRSLPLVTGGLLAAGAVVATAANALPPFAWRFYPLAAFATLALATIAFSIAFWWLWQVVKPRDFDYPADDEAISRYASDMMNFHAGQGLEKQALDDEVTRELRLYMASTFAVAAKSTLSNNQIRLSARSQVLVFLLSGFLLAFACYALIFGHRLIHGTEADGATTNGAQAASLEQESRRPEAGAALAPSHASDPRRGMVDKIHHSTSNSEQVNGGREKAVKRRAEPATHSGGSTGGSPYAEIDQTRHR